MKLDFKLQCPCLYNNESHVIMINNMKQILRVTANILLMLVATSQTDTESKDVCYMSLCSRLHAPPLYTSISVPL